jgi:hypothetical protein
MAIFVFGRCLRDLPSKKGGRVNENPGQQSEYILICGLRICGVKYANNKPVGA